MNITLQPDNCFNIKYNLIKIKRLLAAFIPQSIYACRSLCKPVLTANIMLAYVLLRTRIPSQSKMPVMRWSWSTMSVKQYRHVRRQTHSFMESSRLLHKSWSGESGLIVMPSRPMSALQIEYVDDVGTVYIAARLYWGPLAGWWFRVDSLLFR
jgi:hypothetical protein